MLVEVTKIKKVRESAIIDIKPNYYVFIIKLTGNSGQDDRVTQIITDTLDCHFTYDKNQFSGYEVIKIFIYCLNSEHDGSQFLPNWNGKAISISISTLQEYNMMNKEILVCVEERGFLDPNIETMKGF